MNNIEALTEELHNVYRRLNIAFFDGELPDIAITIQSGGKRSTMGWCSRQPIWFNTEGSVKLYEINISAEYLNIAFLETINTMLHEMVHLYNKVHKIKDVSRSGQYHNKLFRDECLRRGYYYESDKPDKKHGWTFAKLTAETISKVESLPINQSVFTIARNTFGTVAPENEEDEDQTDEEEPRRKSHIRKIVCPSCGNSVRASKEVNIRCDDCDEKMIEELPD